MYYLTTIQTFSNNSPNAASLLGYETLESATIALLNTLASSIADVSVNTVFCQIVNVKGMPYRTELWERNNQLTFIED